MFGSFLPSPWSSTNHSVLGSKEPTLLCNHLNPLDGFIERTPKHHAQVHVFVKNAPPMEH
jgi:hypothetical protein